jgi:hypothetical protein
LSEIPDQCLNYGPWELTEGSPAGGEYSGPGVLEGWFYPDVAGLGLHTITYTYTDENGCINEAEQSVFVDACTGVDEMETGISVYPNPTTGLFEVIFMNPITDADIEVYNAVGELIFRRNNISAASLSSYQIDLRNAPSGIYLLMIDRGENGAVTILIE